MRRDHGPMTLSCIAIASARAAPERNQTRAVLLYLRSVVLQICKHNGSTIMKKILLAAAVAMLVAGPAFAQTNDGVPKKDTTINTTKGNSHYYPVTFGIKFY